MASKKTAKKATPARTKPAAKGATAGKAPAKKAVAKRTTAKEAAAKKPAFGRPGTSGKAEGDAAVRAWIAAVKPEHRAIVARLDALIADTVPGVKKAIKWSTPLYGSEGKGYFASVASFKSYVSLGFFEGASLDPPPPVGEGEMRRVNLASLAEVDEPRFRGWIRQAAALQGWAKA